MGLVWIELFESPGPAGLSAILVIYSALTIVGVVLFGKGVWFSRADPFTAYFALIGKLAPVAYRPEQDGTWRAQFRPFFSAAASDRPEHISVVLFVLFMLSSTTYDAIHDTALWTSLYWTNGLWLLQPVWGTDLGKAQQLLMGGYLVYRQVGLLLFPFVYLGVYLLILWWARTMARAPARLNTLAVDFCNSLLPIAVAYNITHYFTFVVTQVCTLPTLIADPFGLDARQISSSPVLPMGLVWHVEVAVILLGHITSVCLAHSIAVHTFASRRQAVISQVPLLVLMIGYTTVGLWILSLPLGPRSS